MQRTITIATFFLFSICAYSQSGTQNMSTLTINQIMQGEGFVGYLPNNIRWSDNSGTVYFSWNPDGDTLRSTYKINVQGDAKTSEPVKVPVEELKTLAGRGTYNKARSRKVYSKNGDLFLLEMPGFKTTQITNTLEREGSPAFSGDETKIIFQKGNNLYAWEIASGTLQQLSDFKKGSKKKDAPQSERDDWLEQDQLELFEILAERKDKRETREYRNDLLRPDRPKTYYHGKKGISNIRISPDMRYVTFRLTDSGNGERTAVPKYVTQSGKVETGKARSKVGSPVDATEQWIYDIGNDTVYSVDNEQIPGIYDKPDFLKDYWRDTLPFDDQYESARPVVFHGPIFSEDGKALLSAKSQDNKDRWLFLLDLASGDLKLLERQRDEAWVGGPGIYGWNAAMGNVGWLADNKHIYFQSEETGFSHLYLLNVETGEKNALTKGNFEIIDVELSNDKQFFYINSNKETPFEHHFYKMPVSGGEMQQITYQPGNNDVSVSPDEKWLAVRYSYSNKPWELFLMPNKVGATMQQVTISTTDDFRSYKWRDPEMVWFTASDGVEVPARLYRPAGSERNGAAVVFVHGAGYLQNVHSWWSSYYREFMFHNILVDNGFTVLDIDYRGSNGYGRDCRTAIYRFMGGKDLSDQVDGAHYLAEEHGINADRIGIYGGSYGGFITLMGLFTSPGTFKSGAAIRSVTDWAHYNHGYTSNILNTPVEDSIAFRKSSPIYHAEGMEGNLLILHGMVDDNVHFQDVVRLAQRLIELGKENWEFAVFPLERHGFVEPSSWTDEYKRIYKLFWETLRE